MNKPAKEYDKFGSEIYYLMGDQPTTCGICGARTEFEEIGDTLQSHQCLNPACGYEFFVVDEEFRHNQD